MKKIISFLLFISFVSIPSLSFGERKELKLPDFSQFSSQSDKVEISDKDCGYSYNFTDKKTTGTPCPVGHDMIFPTERQGSQIYVPPVGSRGRLVY